MNDKDENNLINDEIEVITPKAENQILSPNLPDTSIEEKLNQNNTLLTQILACAKGIKGVLSAILILIILWYILSFAGFIY